jgi:oligosaccharide reducing-end xylanase
MKRAGNGSRQLGIIWPVLMLAAVAACGGDDDDGANGANGGGGGANGGGGSGGDEVPPPPEPTELTKNLFGGLLGKTDAEVSEKVTTAVNRFFGIGTGEPATLVPDSGYRCYYELPQDPTQAFIWAADTNDIRSEGMSYGMMIAVQTDLHEQFDRLWKFTQTYLQYPADSTTSAWQNYFKWQGRVDTTDPASWVVNYGATTVPAPDGDEYFAAALYLAHRRWGSAGAVNYLEEAQRITSSMLHNAPTVRTGPMDQDRYPIIHPTENMVTFVPQGNSNGFSDPSYHLPAFYDLFALDGPAADSAAWTSVAETSRDFLQRSAHATTGLHPDYANFDGTPNTGGMGQTHDQFRYDAWRVVMNMAVDYAWFSRDRQMRLQIEKYHEFFSTRLTENNVQNQLFLLDGSLPSDAGGGSGALTATLAAGSLASQREDRTRFVENLWNVGQQQGLYRYYQEGVYLLALLNVAGEFNYTWE